MISLWWSVRKIRSKQWQNRELGQGLWKYKTADTFFEHDSSMVEDIWEKVHDIKTLWKSYLHFYTTLYQGIIDTEFNS